MFNIEKLYIADPEDCEVVDDEISLLEAIAEAKKNDEERLHVTFLVGLCETFTSIAKVLHIIEVTLR